MGLWNRRSRWLLVIAACGCSLAEYKPELAPWQTDAGALSQPPPPGPDDVPAGVEVIADAAGPTCAFDGCWRVTGLATQTFAPSADATCAGLMGERRMDTRDFHVQTGATELQIDGIGMLPGSGPEASTCLMRFEGGPPDNQFVVELQVAAADLHAAVTNVVTLPSVTCEMTWGLALSRCP